MISISARKSVNFQIKDRINVDSVFQLKDYVFIFSSQPADSFKVQARLILSVSKCPIAASMGSYDRPIGRQNRYLSGPTRI